MLANTQPFTEDDFVGNVALVEAALVQCGHDHLDIIAGAIERGHWAHRKIHELGQEESKTHELLIQDIQYAEQAFRRGLNAMWS